MKISGENLIKYIQETTHLAIPRENYKARMSSPQIQKR